MKHELTEFDKAYYLEAMNDLRVAREAYSDAIKRVQQAESVANGFLAYLWKRYDLKTGDEITPEGEIVTVKAD